MPALSPSRAADFMQCPLLYRFRVIDKLPEPPTPAMARGTLVHAVLENLFLAPAPERTPARARTLIAPAWAEMVRKRPELAGLPAGDGPAPPRGEQPGGTDGERASAGEDSTGDGTGGDGAGGVAGDRLQAWFDQALALIDRWFTLEDPTRLEPAERELYVEADLGGLTLRGYVDRLDVAPDGRMRVVDYKTGRAPREAYEGKALFQMKFYGLVLWKMTGRIPARLQLVYLGSGDIVAYDPAEAELRALARKLTALWAAIERCLATGEFAPSPSRLCDWCRHRELCPAFGGIPPVLPEGALEAALAPSVTSRGDG